MWWLGRKGVPQPAVLDQPYYLGLANDARRRQRTNGKYLHKCDSLHGEIETLNSRRERAVVRDTATKIWIKEAARRRRVVGGTTGTAATLWLVLGWVRFEVPL